MRSVLAVMAVLVGMSVSGMAQSQPNQFKVKPSKSGAAAEPKSTAPVKVPAATTSSATSKELRSVERETPKASGAANPKKAPKTVVMKPSKSDKNPPMNFGGKGGASGTAGMTRQSSAYKGRLKQKGQGHN